MKYLLFRVNLKLGNSTLSFGRLRQRIVLKCVPHVRHDYFASFNQSHHCFLASSLLKFPTSAGPTFIRFDNNDSNDNDGVRLKAVYSVQWGLPVWLK